MAHANVVDNEMVDDHGIPFQELPFANRYASKFCDQIQQFASQRRYVPCGWHRIFDRSIHSLKAVDCPQRDGIELSEIAFGQGFMRVATYYSPTDKVVSGILSCLSKRSACTCQECGRGYGAVYRMSCSQTLCARCHVRADLNTELEHWLQENAVRRAHKRRPLIEFDSLPLNIRLLIPMGEVKTLRLISDGRKITYVTPEAVIAHVKALTIMKRYLAQADQA